jgi:hypothetical protein
MVTFPTPQSFIYSNFKGIRTRNGVNTGGQISAIVCQNVDFIPNTVGSDIQIKSTLGNVLVAQYPDFSLIKGFETEQDGIKHLLVYAENETKGILLEYNTIDEVFEVIQDDLLVTGQANGITMNDTAYDVFVFTNGKDYYSINFAITPITQVINPVYNGKQLTGLSLCEKDGALVIGSEEFAIVIGSRQGDIYDWDYAVTADDKIKPWYQPFGKSVTAVVPYIGGLLVFTADDSTMLKGNPADLATFERLDASIGGCMSFESWCYHDKYLFFYDDTQKNIYYYTQIDTGQKILGEPIAPEVQKYFDDVKRLQFTGYVGENRNEIWILSDKFKLIYDYFIGEWSERVCQDISSYYVYDNAVYSTTPDGKILKEKEGVDSCKFDEVFYPAVYTMQTINLGSYSNMKEMEMQPLFTVSDDNDNEFVIDCLIDGKKTKSKKVQLIVKGGIWGDDSDEITPECQFDVAVFGAGSDNITHQLKGKFVSNWYYLQFTIRTEELGQEFNILAMELKGITMETDTIGRK